MTARNKNTNDKKEKKTFNLSEFNENKTAYSCCYSGITFYQPVRRSR
ncbi:MAG: hypothetical protein IKF60_00910 [Solobacterium sp.]|nr:hypothetical protein [Solobacterium sp.]MBR3346552.1 hypothetical protein [Solobacterium sp.]